MPLRPITIAFPSGGVDRRHSFQEQPPYTTPDSLNIWPFDASTGKRRLGTRAGITAYGAPTNEPYHWCPVSYQEGTGVGSTMKSSVALANAGHAYIYDSGWVPEIAGGPGTGAVTRSVAMYLQTLFFANGMDDTPFEYMPTSASGDLGDAVAGPLNLTIPGTGTTPVRCTLAASWGDRLILGGDYRNSQIVYGCRIGNYRDWDETAIDPASSFQTGSAFGLIHPPVTSLIPVNQHVLMIGGMDSIHTLRGNPSGGGTHQMITSSVGPIRNNSWCKMQDGTILFMSRSGLYRTNGSSVDAVSRNKLPLELKGIGAADADRASVAYDTLWNGVHIVGQNAGTPFAFFLDMEKEGFWPMAFSGFDPIMAMSSPQVTSSESSNVLLLESNECNQYDATSSDPADCHMCYGPIPMNGQFGEGVLQEIYAILGEDSDTVHWCIYIGNSPQEAWVKVQADLDSGGSSDDDNADFTGVDWEISGSRMMQYVQRPMERGNCFYLKVWGLSTGDKPIAIEEILGKVSVSPERRVR